MHLCLLVALLFQLPHSIADLGDPPISNGTEKPFSTISEATKTRITVVPKRTNILQRYKKRERELNECLQ